MNKKGLINRIMKKEETTLLEAEKILNTVLDCIQESLNEDRTIELRNFGKFERVTRKEKRIRNLRTGVPQVIPEHEIITFKSSKNFIRSSNGNSRSQTNTD